MLIYVIKDCNIAGTDWPAGTKLQCPDREAEKALKDGRASLEPVEPAKVQAPEQSEETEDAGDESSTPKRRGRPPKSE